MRPVTAPLWLLLLSYLVLAYDISITDTVLIEDVTENAESSHLTTSLSELNPTYEMLSTDSGLESEIMMNTTGWSTPINSLESSSISQDSSSLSSADIDVESVHEDVPDTSIDENLLHESLFQSNGNEVILDSTLEVTSINTLVSQSSDVASSSVTIEMIEPPSTPILQRPSQDGNFDSGNTTNVSLFDDISFLESNRLIFEAAAHEGSDLLSSNDSQGFMSFEEWKKHKQQPENGTNASASANVKAVSKPVTKPKPPQKRFNFALADCAATVVDTLGKGAGAILNENKDLYLLNECHLEHQFVVIELCQEIYVESVVIGNYEFFSSQFKDVRILVLDVFPSTKWWILGEFTAENFRNVQQFLIESPKIWARYLKIEVLSHYGNEYYCPISVVRAHGKTMMEDAKEDSPLDNKNFVEASIQPPQLDKCIINPPYLGLSQFLQDINLTNTLQGYDLCDAEPIISTSLESQQESVYKTIMKRLTLLESNATLSLLYIEEQLKLLLEAFVNLEKRQSLNFDSLVALFNHTISTLLLNFRSNYAHLHQEYLKLLLMQKQTHEEIVRDTKYKLSFLSGELLFQERVSLFNLVIIICMLIYVVITRQAYVDDVKDRARLPNHLRQHRVKRPGRRRRRRLHYVHH
ncbi:SUN domain-containing protein [Kocuria palustris]|nr:SUN domain-containing protein [Kocuria palustris]